MDDPCPRCGILPSGLLVYHNFSCNLFTPMELEVLQQHTVARHGDDAFFENTPDVRRVLKLDLAKGQSA